MQKMQLQVRFFFCYHQNQVKKTFKFCLLFRHADRDVVLEHVKSHYRDDGTPQENKQAPSNMELGPPPLPIQMPFQIMNNLLNGHTTGTSANVHNPNLITLSGGGGGINQMQSSNINSSTTHQTLNFNPTNTLTLSSTSSSHDVGKNNNGMPETNSANSSLKGSFRCGHCGQISNWKHVIQVYTNNKNQIPCYCYPQSIIEIDNIFTWRRI